MQELRCIYCMRSFFQFRQKTCCKPYAYMNLETTRNPIKAPEILLTRNEGKNTKAPSEHPINRLAYGTANNEPITPVPMISPITAMIFRPNCLYNTPAKIGRAHV